MKLQLNNHIDVKQVLKTKKLTIDDLLVAFKKADEADINYCLRSFKKDKQIAFKGRKSAEEQIINFQIIKNSNLLIFFMDFRKNLFGLVTLEKMTLSAGDHLDIEIHKTEMKTIKEAIAQGIIDLIDDFDKIRWTGFFNKRYTHMVPIIV